MSQARDGAVMRKRASWVEAKPLALNEPAADAPQEAAPQQPKWLNRRSMTARILVSPQKKEKNAAAPEAHSQQHQKEQHQQGQQQVHRTSSFERNSMRLGKAASFSYGSQEKEPQEKERSSSPSKKQPVVPCVAHSVYTGHDNCGHCHSPLRRRSSAGIQPISIPEEKNTEETQQEAIVEPPPLPVKPVPDFEDLQRLGVLPVTNMRGVALFKNEGVRTSIVGDKAGEVKERHSLSAEPFIDTPLFHSKSPVSAMHSRKGESGGVEVWCGFLDGFVRIFTSDPASLAVETQKHAGAVTDIISVGRMVYSSSLDWKIVQWNGMLFPSSGSCRAIGAIFASHSLGVRALCEARVSDLPVLASGGDDCEIRIWRIHGEAPASERAPEITLKAHEKGVLSLLYAHGFLWSGGEDGIVRVWDLRLRRPCATFSDHTSGVQTLCLIGNNVWSFGKNGVGVMYHAERKEKVWKQAFVEEPSGRGKPGARLFHILPVEGHIVWVAAPSGTATAWYAPTPIVSGALAVHRSSMGDFERLEQEAEASFRYESIMHSLVNQLESIIEEHFKELNRILAECFSARLTAAEVEENMQTIRKLRVELERQKQLCESLNKEKLGAQELAQKLEASKANEEKANQTIRELQKQVSQLQKEIRDMKRRSTAVQDDKSTAVETQVVELRAALEKAHTKIAELQKLLRERDHEIFTHKAAEKRDRRGAEASDVELRTASNEILSLKEQLESLKSKLDTAVHQKDDAIRQKDEALREKDDILRQKDDALAALAEIEKGQRTEGEGTEHDDELGVLTKARNEALREAKDQEEELRKTRKLLEGETTRSQETEQYLRRTIDELGQKLRVMLTTLDDLREENVKLQSENDDIETLSSATTRKRT